MFGIKFVNHAILEELEDIKHVQRYGKTKQEAEGKKVHTGGGFSGKGFKFDETEAAAINERRKFQKAALGLQDSDDEDLEHEDDDLEHEKEDDDYYSEEELSHSETEPTGKDIDDIERMLKSFETGDTEEFED